MTIAQDGEELIFSKISRTDSGAYLCIASNGVPPSVSKRIILDVECMLSFCHYTRSRLKIQKIKSIGIEDRVLDEYWFILK